MGIHWSDHKLAKTLSSRTIYWHSDNCVQKRNQWPLSVCWCNNHIPIHAVLLQSKIVLVSNPSFVCTRHNPEPSSLTLWGGRESVRSNAADFFKMLMEEKNKTQKPPFLHSCSPMALPRSSGQSSIQFRCQLPSQLLTQCDWFRETPHIQSRDHQCSHQASLWPWFHNWGK